MRSQLVAIRDAGKQLSKSFKDKALSDYPTALGYASPQGDEVHIGTFVSPEYNLAEALEEIETKYKDDRVFYQFIHSDEDLKAESMPPFNILDNGEEEEKMKVLLAVLSDGDFPDFEEGEADESNDYRFVQSHLLPKMGELLEISDGDIGTLVTLCEKKQMKEYIGGKLKPRGSLVIVPPTKDKALGYMENPQSAQWSWGYSTKSLGLQENVQKTSATPGKLTLKKTAGEQKVTPKEEEEEKKPDEKVSDARDKMTRLLKHDSLYMVGTDLRFRPPKNTQLKEAKTLWSKHSVLELPKDKDGDIDAAKLYAGFPVTKLRPDSTVKAFIDRVMNEGKEPKKADADVATPPEEKKEQQAKNELTLFVSKEQKEKYANMLKGDKLVTRVSGEELARYAREWPRFSLQVGETPDNILHWSKETLARVGNQVGTHALLALANEYRLMALNIYEEEKKEVEPEEKKEETPVAAPQPKKLSLRKAG